MLGFNTTDNYGMIQPIEQGIGFRNLCLNPSGANVGIGTTSPTKGRLEVGLPANTFSYTGFGFLNRNGAGSSGSSVSRSISIYGEGVIIAGTEFNTLSDGRIKNIQGHSDGSADLATLNRIEITDYTHKDVIAKGNVPQKKVIAQQVEKVFPQAVNQHTDVVPDIYQKAEVKDGWVKLATNLKKGERVRLIGNKNQGIHEVLEAEQDRFRTDFAADGDTVFVYGRQVNDFRTVDYDAIAMLNVSATQELARKLAAQESKLTELRAEVEKLRSERKSLARSVSDLSARDQAWEARFTKLERALASGAEPQGASEISARTREGSVNSLAQ
jgi:tmRNA-binding protein